MRSGAFGTMVVARFLGDGFKALYVQSKRKRGRKGQLYLMAYVYSLTHFYTLSLTFTLYLSLTFTLYLSLFHSLSLSLSLSFFLLTFTLYLSLFHSLSLSLLHLISLSRIPSFPFSIYLRWYLTEILLRRLSK